jgi:Trk K+ transport system NAD-binding subunit
MKRKDQGHNLGICASVAKISRVRATMTILIKPKAKLPYRRQLRAAARDTWLLLRQFGWLLAVFLAAEVGGGIAYYLFSRTAGRPLANVVEAIYEVLGLTFFQPLSEFPDAWYLELFYFVMPLVGLAVLAQGIAEFGVMLFNRRARGKDWEMAVASTFNHHVVLVGLGHLGFRVARNLYHMEQDVVVVELNPAADLVLAVKEMGIPVIQDDATREVTLDAAGVRRARTIVLCTQNDSMNLQIALKARRMNPRLQVVVRIFDDEFADALQEQFGFTAMSATSMAAPAFAAAAANVDMTRPIVVEGESMSLARLKLTAQSALAGRSIGDIEKQYNLSVVLLRRNQESDLHPAAETELMAGDALAVLGGINEISLLAQDNGA